MNMSLQQHINKHHDKYSEIEKNLKQINTEFRNATRTEQRKMFKAAHQFAVLSIQTPVKLHEDAFRALQGLETENPQPVTSVNYWKNKISYINNLDGKTEQLDQIIDLLLAGRVDEAHRKTIDKVKGLGAAKAAFALAMLGFLSRACLDTNVRQATGIEEPYTGVVVDKYMNQVSTALNQFEELEDTPMFMKQWIVFDYQRGEFTNHECWFTAVENIYKS